MKRIVVGLDCGRGNVTACVISAEIANLKEFARSYKALIFRSNLEDLEALANLGDIFALEPTGAEHRVFVDFLQRKDKLVLYCKGERIRNHAVLKGLRNKKDREDAAAVADYTYRGLYTKEIPNPFLSLHGEEIRELHYSSRSIDRLRVALSNQIYARLAYELPEFLYTESGAKRKITNREWGQENPPLMLRWLAGEKDNEKYNLLLKQTIGRGISEHTRQLVSQLCMFERQKYQLEKDLEEQLRKIEPWYNAAFDKWNLSASFRIAFLCSIYPFEKFLGEEGKPIHEYIPATSPSAKRKKTFRDRSLKQFMLQMGMGRVIAESGTSKGEWVMGGSRPTRCYLYLFIKTGVQFSLEQKKPGKRKDETKEEFQKRLKAEWSPFREWLPDLAKELCQKKVEPWENPDLLAAVVERNGVTSAIARLQIYYLLSPTCSNLKDQQRVMKLAGRFTRDLYRELLKQYKAHTGV